MGIFRNIVVIENRQHPETNTISFEDIGLDAKRPQNQDEIAHSPPNRKSNLELWFRLEIDVIIDKQEKNGAQHKHHNS